MSGITSTTVEFRKWKAVGASEGLGGRLARGLCGADTPVRANKPQPPYPTIFNDFSRAAAVLISPARKRWVGVCKGMSPAGTAPMRRTPSIPHSTKTFSKASTTRFYLPKNFSNASTSASQNSL